MQEETARPRDLLQATAGGDKAAFHALYCRYAPRVVAAVRRRVTAPQLAEELVQDVFVAAWQSARAYRADVGDPDLWLLGIVRHKLQDHWRRVARLADTMGIPLSDVLHEAPMPDPDVRMSIEQALSALSTEQRRVIDLIYASGLTFAEAARVLGVPVGTVKSRAHTALGRMRAFLSQSARP